MSENETIGRMSCPICGEPLQDVRISKRGKLYMICDNNCRVNFSGKQSKKWLPILRAGQAVREDKILITTLQGAKQNDEARTGNNRDFGESRGDSIIGRTNVGYTRPAAGTITPIPTTASKPTAKRGILAGFLDDDDE